MTDNFIQLGKNNTLKLEIRTNEGVSTGEYLEFDLEDIELPLKYQTLVEKHKKNKEYIINMLNVIDKRQDVKGKKLLSKNEEDKMKAIEEFYQKEVEIYNIFLGENGVQKLLNGRKIGITTLQEIDEIIANQIVPYLDKNMKDIATKIKNKYGTNNTNKEELK